MTTDDLGGFVMNECIYHFVCNSLHVSLMEMFSARVRSSSVSIANILEGMKRKDERAMKRVAAGTYLPTPWLFEPAKHPDDRPDYCLG